jgi:hypothetical protein
MCNNGRYTGESVDDPPQLYGWREWNVRPVTDPPEAPQGYHLAAMYGGCGVWDGPTMHAACRGTEYHEETAPAPAAECTCGLHAFYTFHEVLRQTGCKAGEAFGFFEAAGKVHLHERGFRAAWGRPKLIVINMTKTSFEDKKSRRILWEAMGDLERRYDAEILAASVEEFLSYHDTRPDHLPTPPLDGDLDTIRAEIIARSMTA